MLYKSKLLTLETMVYSWDYLDEHWYMGPSGHLYSYWIILDCLGHVCIWVNLPVRERCRVTRHSRVFPWVDG